MIDHLLQMGQAAQIASRQLSTLATVQKNTALLSIADELETQASLVLEQNALDIQTAKEKGLSAALLDRLLLNEQRLVGLAADTRRVAELPDPVGKDIESRVLPNGIRLSKRRIPIGVIGVIYEARPNVTIDIATLCLKTGNAVILRGGSETLRSNLALVHVVQTALQREQLPQTAGSIYRRSGQRVRRRLLRLDRYVDMIIPRGGAGLHKLCREQSTIPVITGGIGICHLYVDESADLERAVDIVENAKVQRPSVCNALDTLLVHQAVAPQFLPPLAARLAQSSVELRADAQAFTILQNSRHGATVAPAGPDDFDREWLALILGIKVVAGIDDAIAHIQQHSFRAYRMYFDEQSRPCQPFCA